jgi:hypothetical protein
MSKQSIQEEDTMDIRTTATRAAAKAAADLLAISECPYVNHLAANAARLIIGALSEPEASLAEASLAEALEMSGDTPQVNDLVVPGVEAARRFLAGR